MSRARKRVMVTGRVQGVFFRDRVRSEAQRLGVQGWVRNLPAGSVEAIFEAEEADVARMIEFCRKGPSGARVDDIEVTDEPARGEDTGFSVR